MKINWRRLKWVIATTLIASLLLGTGVMAQSFPRTPVGWLLAQRLTVNTTSTLTGNVAANSNLAVADDFTVSPQPILTLTMNGWLTPTGSFQPIRSAGAVGVSGGRIAPGAQGQFLYLYNMGAQTITISETTGLVSAGNIALGALDAATLVYSGTTWIQLAGSNN
jgi:hypothetical protein